LRLELALHGSDLGLWDWNIPSGRVDFNERWVEMLGYSLDEIVPNVAIWEKLAHPDDWPAVHAAIDLHLRGKTSSYECELRIRHKDGHWVWIHDCGKVVERNADGAPIRAVGTHLEITERKHADIKLRQSEEQLRLIVDGVRDYAVIMLDSAGRIISWNSGVEHIKGYRADEIIGKHFSCFYLDNDVNLGKPEQELAIAMKEGRYEVEGWRLRKDGSRFLANVVITSLYDEARELRGFVKVTRDITERKQAETEHEKLEAQLRQAQKMEAVGRLAGGVAHDFNNMLQVIISYAELALERLTPSDPLHAAVQQIMKAGRRSADLTGQLLAFARKQIIAPKVLDLNESVAGILKMLQRLIGEDIDLAFVPGHDLGKVKMDPSQVDQILANLAVNARDAISSVGKVTIETDNAELDESYCRAHDGFLPGQYVLLAVNDDGCGMDKETQARLFEPFFTTKPQGQGTGLGLATVYGIVKQNNGFINVYSEPGKGTTFKIYLPRLQSDMAAIDETPKYAEAPNGTETVLLVDDEETLLGLGKMLLEVRGYTALAAGSPSQAIQLAEQYAGDIHLLLTDVVMPDMSGHELWQRLSAQRPGLKCLFMSGYTANAIAHRGVLDEGIHFLQKPFSVEQLAVKLREALDRP
jgi:two-component system cell cycle sensor histidine kinase/response regulator CckA